MCLRHGYFPTLVLMVTAISKITFVGSKAELDVCNNLVYVWTTVTERNPYMDKFLHIKLRNISTGLLAVSLLFSSGNNATAISAMIHENRMTTQSNELVVTSSHAWMKASSQTWPEQSSHWLACQHRFAGSWNLKDPEGANGVKSRTGFLLTFAVVPLLWKSSFQSLITLSSQESEYIALSIGMRSLVHLQSLLSEICSNFNLTYGDQISTIITIFEDNQAAVILATTDLPRLTPRSKHIAIWYHWFCSHLGIKDGNGIIINVASSLNKADFLTKALAKSTFDETV